MLAPVNGRDWQFITADSHTAERGPGGGTSPRGTPLEEPIPSSLPKHPPTGKQISVCRASKGKKQTNPKPNSASVVRSIRGRQGQPAVTATYGTWAGQLQPWTCSPDCARAAASGAAGLCHPRGHCSGSRGPCVPLFRRKFSRFACSPRQGGCLLPATSSCQPSGKRRQESGRQEIPRPQVIPLPEGFLGPGRAVGGPPWKVVPGRAGRVGRRCRTRVRSQHPADTHSLCFGYFSREARLGRELLLALRAAPAGRSIPSVGALGGGGFPGRVLRPR